MSIPKRYLKFGEDYPEILNAYEMLGEAVQKAGPLEKKTKALIKLSISIGAKMEGAVHSHTRKALEAGCSEIEIKQVVLLSLPTLGFPSMMAAMTWVEDVFEKKKDQK